MKFPSVFMLILLFLTIPVAASETESQVDLILTLDAASIDAVWDMHAIFRLGFEMRHQSGIGLKIPLSLTLDRSGGGEALLESAVKLLCLPWSAGPFICISLVRVCLFVGPYLPQERIHYLNELEFGYSWEFLPGWFVQPSILLRDPSNGFPESHAYIQGLIPSYGRLRFCMEFGWNFATIETE